MSTEVEARSQVDSGLTAAPEEGTHLQPGGQGVQPGQQGSERPLSGPETNRENDKENDQSAGGGGLDPAVEAVKTKVVEAPPPKVNPWTKRTTGRVPVPVPVSAPVQVHPPSSSGSGDRGEAADRASSPGHTHKHTHAARSAATL